MQTFYSFILITVNKKVLPLHNLPLPLSQKKIWAGYVPGLQLMRNIKENFVRKYVKCMKNAKLFEKKLQ